MNWIQPSLYIGIGFLIISWFHTMYVIYDPDTHILRFGLPLRFDLNGSHASHHDEYPTRSLFGWDVGTTSTLLSRKGIDDHSDQGIILGPVNDIIDRGRSLDVDNRKLLNIRTWPGIFSGNLTAYHAYFGSIVLGMFMTLSSLFVFNFLLPTEGATVGDLLVSSKVGIVFTYILVSLIISQFVGGGSWSKFVLDGSVLFTGFLILISNIALISFWPVLSIYLALAGIQIGAGMKWLRFAYHHTSAWAFLYYSIGSLYSLFISLLILVPNISY